MWNRPKSCSSEMSKKSICYVIVIMSKTFWHVSNRKCELYNDLFNKKIPMEFMNFEN